MAAWAFAILLFVYAGYLAWGRRGSHAGGVIWCAVWATMFALYRLVGPLYAYDVVIVFWTGVFCLLFMGGFHAGAFSVQFKSKHSKEDDGLRYYDFAHLKIAIISCIAIGFGAPLKFMTTAGINIGQILNVFAYFDVIQSTHDQMVQGSVEQDPITKICLMFAMAGVLLAGLYIGLGRPGKKVTLGLCIATISPFFAMTALSTVRSFVIVPLVMMVCALIAGMTAKGVEQKLFRPLPIFSSLAVVSFLIAMILVLQSIRLGDYQFRSVGDTVAHMRPWAAGYMPALTVWYLKVWDHQLTWGALCFKGIVSLLGVRGEGFDVTFYQMPIGMGHTSNAMTCLRFLIADFGFVGGIASGLIFGFVSGLLSGLSRKGSLAATVLLGTMLAAIVWAPNSWFLAYGTRLLSPFITLAYVVAFARKANPPASELPLKKGARVPVRVRPRSQTSNPA